MREITLSNYGGIVHVHSKLQGSNEIPIKAIDNLSSDVDILWITVKTPSLHDALTRIDASVSPFLAIPLLNGLAHLAPLRERFGSRLVSTAIRIEAERTAPGHVTWDSGYAAIELGAAPGAHERPRVEALAAEVRAAGIECTVNSDPDQVLWRKLILLVPLALATTAADGPVGVVRRDEPLRELMRDSARQLCALAAARGVAIDPAEALAALDDLPGRTDTSLHRDVAAGRDSELAALTRPLLDNDHLADLSCLARLTERARAAIGANPPG